MLEKMIRSQTAKQEQQLESFLARHDAANPFPEDVLLTADADYMGDGRPCHRMDIFRPREAKEALPVLVNIHGGGFLLGKKEVNRLFCADMCRRGFVVFCLEYPLVPDVDIFTVFRALTAGIERAAALAPDFGGDASRLFLCGDSAGAYLCVYLAAMRKNAAMARAAGVPQLSPDIAALGLISGMFYTTRFDNIGIFLPNIVYGRGWRHAPFREYIDPENPSLIAALPPCFLVTARGDFLRHYSRDFAATLKKNGLEAELLDMDEPEKLAHAFAAMLPETAAAPPWRIFSRRIYNILKKVGTCSAQAQKNISQSIISSKTLSRSVFTAG